VHPGHGPLAQKTAEVGDVIIASGQAGDPECRRQKGDVVRASSSGRPRSTARPDGSYIRFDENAPSSSTTRGTPRTRIFGPVARELRTATT